MPSNSKRIYQASEVNQIVATQRKKMVVSFFILFVLGGLATFLASHVLYPLLPGKERRHADDSAELAALQMLAQFGFVLMIALTLLTVKACQVCLSKIRGNPTVFTLYDERDEDLTQTDPNSTSGTPLQRNPSASKSDAQQISGWTSTFSPPKKPPTLGTHGKW